MTSSGRCRDWPVFSSFHWHLHYSPVTTTAFVFLVHQTEQYERARVPIAHETEGSRRNKMKECQVTVRCSTFCRAPPPLAGDTQHQRNPASHDLDSSGGCLTAVYLMCFGLFPEDIS